MRSRGREGGREGRREEEQEEEVEEGGGISMEGLVASVQRLRWERDAVSRGREGGREGRKAGSAAEIHIFVPPLTHTWMQSLEERREGGREGGRGRKCYHN